MPDLYHKYCFDTMPSPNYRDDEDSNKNNLKSDKKDKEDKNQDF